MPVPGIDVLTACGGSAEEGYYIETFPDGQGGTAARCCGPGFDCSSSAVRPGGSFGWRRATPAEMGQGGRRGRRPVQYGRLAARNQAAKILEPGITGARTAPTAD